MKKIFTYIFAAIAFFLLNAAPLRALEITNEESAIFKTTSLSSNNDFDYRISNLRNFLEKYDSPLAEHAEDFVIYADTYNIDYRLVPAISGVESTFGKRIPYESYNAYGWANGEYRFTSWENSIDHVSMTLKTKYIDKGASSITKIAHRYAPPSKTWGKNVGFFMNKIDILPLTYDI